MNNMKAATKVQELAALLYVIEGELIRAEPEMNASMERAHCLLNVALELSLNLSDDLRESE